MGVGRLVAWMGRRSAGVDAGGVGARVRGLSSTIRADWGVLRSSLPLRSSVSHGNERRVMATHASRGLASALSAFPQRFLLCLSTFVNATHSNT